MKGRRQRAEGRMTGQSKVGKRRARSDAPYHRIGAASSNPPENEAGAAFPQTKHWDSPALSATARVATCSTPLQ